jgi:two-component system response regulator DevR
VLKDVVGVDMVATVEKIAAGESLLDPITTRRVMEQLRATAPVSMAGPLQRLTAQELRVLSQVAEGRSDKEVADALNLSAKTVRNYLDNIFAKLDVHSRTQAAVLYEQLRSGGRSL